METKLAQIYTQNELTILKESFKSPKNVCVFLNFLKTNENLINEFFKDLKFQKLNPFCYLFKAEDKSILSKMKAFNEGHFYIQNYSSYLCAKNLGVKPNENILDMCAAPGGKSINLANFMQNKAYLACVEANKERFFTLQKNLKNYGVNAKIFLKDAKNIGRLCPLKFDKILLDAPCSTLAKTGFENVKSPKEIKALALLQKKLLHSALKALKHGGELVYSTCTFLKEENEEVLENALKSEFELEFLELDLEGVRVREAKSEFKELIKARRIMPCENYDGFFIAKMRKI
ncbi:SAM-dependent methyltransferase [Campylobacter upsaliensis]